MQQKRFLRSPDGLVDTLQNDRFIESGLRIGTLGCLLISRGVSLAGRGTHTFLGIRGLRQRAIANNPALSTVIIPPSSK